ncbi:MAG: hypothetical protein KJ040_01940 [Gammaproteobacteria bacterium]|nr:hypothetical protein [Gammaproteobacteria bacterium]
MASELKAALLSAYTRLLRPLVRILLRNGVSYPEFAEVAKKVFVTVVIDESPTGDADALAARAAIRTGITRSEALRVLSDGNSPSIESNLNRITRVLTGWHTDTAYTGPYGLPLELRLTQRDQPSFSSLVETYSPGTQPIALLKELIRIGVVKEIEVGRFRVLTRTYLPKTDVPDSLERIGQAVQHLIETVEHNRLEVDPERRLFERTVYADDGICEEDLPRFKSYVRGRSQLLLEDIDNWLSQLEKPSTEKGKRAIQTGIGIYHYVENKSDD